MTAQTVKSKLAIESPEAKSNAAHNRGLNDELRAHVAAAALGGSEGSGERNVGRGKLLPREQVERLLDIGAGTNEIRRMLIGRELIGAAG